MQLLGTGLTLFLQCNGHAWIVQCARCQHVCAYWPEVLQLKSIDTQSLPRNVLLDLYGFAICKVW